MLVPFAEWRPDVANLNSAFASDVINVLCSTVSYLPFPALTQAAGSTAMTEDAVGGFTAKGPDGTVYTFSGSAEKLWLYNNSTKVFDDVTKTAGAYNASVDDRWQFAQFGPYIVAVNPNDPPQVFEIGSSTEFADLAGSPPSAAYVAVWGPFLVLGGLANNANRVHWSGLEDIEEWTPGNNSCDYQDFPEGIRVMGMTSATNPLVFLEEAIFRGVFIPGSIEVFSFAKIPVNRNIVAPYSIASRDNIVIFWANGGFVQMDYSGAVLPIGREKFDRFFAESASNVSRCVACIDPVYSRYYLAYSTTGDDIFDSIFIYDWVLLKGTRAAVNTRHIMPAVLGGITLEDLDASYASLEDIPISLDSIEFNGYQQPVLFAFDENNAFGAFSGQSMEATITTQETGATDGSVTLVRSVLPVIDTDQAQMRIGARFRRSDDVVWSEWAAPSSNTGLIRKKSRARYHRFQFKIAEGAVWTHGQGADVDGKAAGFR